MRKRKSKADHGALNSTDNPISNPSEQRSPNDQGVAGYDQEDYHAEGPIPVGHAPIHPSKTWTHGMTAGVSVSSDRTGNTGTLPNTGGLSPNPVLSTLATHSTRNLGQDPAQPLEGIMDHHAHLRECIHNCQECHSVCTETAQQCLQMGGKHAEAGHIRLLLDCADICQTSADFMLRGSAKHALTCGTCADICLTCAEECERIGAADTMMKTCADICRTCAESCRQMVHMKAAA